MSEPDDLLADMEREFGPDQTDEYVRLTAATRSLIYVWDQFVRAPVGSAQEKVLNQAMRQMMQGFERRPEKAVPMIESLLAIIQSMRMGGTLEQWFEHLGVDPKPGSKDLK